METGQDIFNGYILIQTERGKARDVCRRVSAFKGITTCHPVTGPYDVIAFAETSNFETTGDQIVQRIERLDGVYRTMTCYALPS